MASRASLAGVLARRHPQCGGGVESALQRKCKTGMLWVVGAVMESVNSGRYWVAKLEIIACRLLAGIFVALVELGC